MKRFLCMALLCTLAVLLISACGRREPVDEEVEYEAPPSNGEAAPVGNFTIPSDDEIHENLALLGKVWGFAKYHHPVFLTGRLCWDLELLRLIPPVLDGGDVLDILYDWFVGLGEIGYDLPYGVYFNLGYLVQQIHDELTPWIGHMQTEVMTELWELVAYFNAIEGSPPGWSEFMYIVENRFPQTAEVVLWEEMQLQDGTEMRIVTDLSWINYENLGLLEGHLLRTGEIRVVGRRNAPVHFRFLSVDIDFTNQNPRGTMMFNNPGERLLALFRLWNAMNYYFPHLDNLEVSWNDLLPRFIPKMLEGTDRQSFEGTLAMLAHYLHDANVLFDGIPFFSRKFGNVVAPVQLVHAEGQFVVYQLAFEGVPLQRGDVILSVNGRDVGEIASEIRPFISYPNDELAYTILGGRWPFPERLTPGFPHVLTSHELFMDIDVLRGRFGMTLNMSGSRMSSTMQQQWSRIQWTTFPYAPTVFLPQAAPTHVLLDDNIGLINPSELGEVRYVMENLASTDGIIIDLRVNTHWAFSAAMMEYLTEEPLPFMYVSHPSQTNPGMFFNGLNRNFSQQNPYAFIYDRPVVLLMDEGIVESAQFTIMSLRNAPNVTVIGTNSMGSILGSTFLPLPGGTKMRFSFVGGFTPEGGHIHGVGLAPDIRVERTIQGIADGRDEIMEAAVRFILEGR